VVTHLSVCTARSETAWHIVRSSSSSFLLPPSPPLAPPRSRAGRNTGSLPGIQQRVFGWSSACICSASRKRASASARRPTWCRRRPACALFLSAQTHRRCGRLGHDCSASTTAPATCPSVSSSALRLPARMAACFQFFC